MHRAQLSRDFSFCTRLLWTSKIDVPGLKPSNSCVSETSHFLGKKPRPCPLLGGWRGARQYMSISSSPEKMIGITYVWKITPGKVARWNPTRTFNKGIWQHLPPTPHAVSLFKGLMSTQINVQNSFSAGNVPVQSKDMFGAVPWLDAKNSSNCSCWSKLNCVFSRNSAEELTLEGFWRHK